MRQNWFHVLAMPWPHHDRLIATHVENRSGVVIQQIHLSMKYCMKIKQTVSCVYDIYMYSTLLDKKMKTAQNTNMRIEFPIVATFSYMYFVLSLSSNLFSF